MNYRDTLKTVGQIRAAAFGLCEQYRTDTPAVRELHDSICKAFPVDSDTPVSVPRAADALLSIAQRWAALDGCNWHIERYERERAELLADTHAIIAKATGSE